MKRVILFILTNLAVMLLVGIILSALGLHSRSVGGILVIALMFGMGGAFISLAMSKWMAKTSTGAEVIDTPRNAMEEWLVSTVKKQAEQSNIGMPEVAIYDSPDMNAFATGMKRNDALVAVSTGLLEQMSQDEAEAVLAHEVSHIANGDMITMTLLQGVLNTFVIFLARMVSNMIDAFLSGDDEEGEGLGFFGYMIANFILEMIFGIFASIIVMWFSRQREFRADAGAAKLVGKNKMIAALERLRHSSEEAELPAQVAAFGISPTKKSFGALFMSHPPLEERIASLRSM